MRSSSLGRWLGTTIWTGMALCPDMVSLREGPLQWIAGVLFDESDEKGGLYGGNAPP